jgi:hypothetical protein
MLQTRILWSLCSNVKCENDWGRAGLVSAVTEGLVLLLQVPLLVLQVRKRLGRERVRERERERETGMREYLGCVAEFVGPVPIVVVLFVLALDEFFDGTNRS